LLAASDIFALPSLYEGSSLALLEAMASRRPVVSSAIPGTDEIIQDGLTGLLIPPNDETALASAIRRLLADGGLRDRLASAARVRAETEFTRETMASRISSVYGRLLRLEESTGDSPPAPTLRARGR
jgi:glycosyltransferase involved in cell wall biosynthesis